MAIPLQNRVLPSQNQVIASSCMHGEHFTDCNKSRFSKRYYSDYFFKKYEE